MMMDKNKIVTAFLNAMLLTALAVYKRYFSFQTQHEFSLVFGNPLLVPRFLIFFVLSALIIALPLNFKVGKEAYREATGYYKFLRARKRFVQNLKDKPIRTLAVTDATKIAKYLNLPLWLTEKMSELANQTVYAFVATATLTTTLLTLTIFILWKSLL